MRELSKREMLYNAVLRTVKEHSSGLEIGLVRAVLNEVDGEIASMANRSSFDTLGPKLTERKPPRVVNKRGGESNGRKEKSAEHYKGAPDPPYHLPVPPSLKKRKNRKEGE